MTQTQTHFAIVLTTHVSPVPAGLEEPSGTFGSLSEAQEALHESRIEWNAAVGGWPFDGCVRIHEYATAEQAQNADVADGFRNGGATSGTNPLSITSL